MFLASWNSLKDLYEEEKPKQQEKKEAAAAATTTTGQKFGSFLYARGIIPTLRMLMQTMLHHSATSSRWKEELQINIEGTTLVVLLLLSMDLMSLPCRLSLIQNQTPYLSMAVLLPLEQVLVMVRMLGIERMPN